VSIASNAVALLKCKKQGHVRQTNGRPGLPGVNRSHLATDNINDIDC
jgi:hypothetical protein